MLSVGVRQFLHVLSQNPEVERDTFQLNILLERLVMDAEERRLVWDFFMQRTNQNLLSDIDVPGIWK
jgi:hypothetical protein